ncbi:hypothetical protein [Sphingobacterium sp. DR205]|uniref:hypothetical protein n=1 Tax=Sphingobacterium sp. DR205 TaxID=2713573 RepID=UPI0013E46D8C|nr:hypothetical protein [Sphingobacterium sp. DR205]QIH35241.1 hypothetical protein G6053_21205 [Sphingobacterium sp. DR205]
MENRVPEKGHGNAKITIWAWVYRYLQYSDALTEDFGSFPERKSELRRGGCRGKEKGIEHRCGDGGSERSAMQGLGSDSSRLLGELKSTPAG